ncbi:MAG: glycerate kinase [Peptococcaceae bacterium]|nr:glycerate kinase [Peptococcaceae bacterium]
MRRIIVAPDSFKESLDAVTVAKHIASGIKQVSPETEVVEVPLSDGGEGLVNTLVSATNGKIVTQVVTGPLGDPVESSYGLLGDGVTAVIEMASASGLGLVPPERRNPLLTTTFGTGELIRTVLDKGYRRLIVGIGGSATNDGGAGMAQALGIKLLNAKGKEIARGAAGLLELGRIDPANIHPGLSDTEILVACDVDNPFCGPSGAAYVYGPQKGATADILPLLDQALEQLAEVIKRDLGKEIRHLPGSGAAGGLGGGLVAFLGGRLCRGIELVFEVLKFEELLARGADLVITGEGEINGQSIFGKVPVGVARLAKKHNLPVLAIVGSIGPGAEKVLKEGIDAIMSVIPGPMSLEEAIRQAPGLVKDASGRAVRIMNLLNKN